VREDIVLRRVLPVLAFALSALAASPVLADNILVIVDLQMQKMHVRHNGETVYRWDVSSGRAGFETPPGRYQPTRMYRKYNSRTYDNAPMPYSIFFVGGYAIHGTADLKNLGRIASHGCVRLDTANAQTLFELVKAVGAENTVIRVESSRASMAVLSEPMPVPGAPEVRAAEATPTALDPLTTAGIERLRPGLDS
jgi:hypothetical protein